MPGYLRQLTNQLGDPLKQRGIVLATREEAVEVIRDRLALAHFFVHLLSLLSQRLTDYPGVAREIEENLAEELGVSERDYGPRHELLRDALLGWLGVDLAAWKARLGTDLHRLNAVPHWARFILEWHVRLAMSKPLEAAAALAYGELRVSYADYPMMRDLLYGPLLGYPPSDTLWVPRTTPVADIPADTHLLSHIDHDVHHFLGLYKELAKVMRERDLETALRKAHEAWEYGWGVWALARA